jgi:hypothetical protein
VYDSVNQLNRTLTNLPYAINACRDDLITYPSEVKPGEWRLLDCNNLNGEKVSSRCLEALKLVGLKN